MIIRFPKILIDQTEHLQIRTLTRRHLLCSVILLCVIIVTVDFPDPGLCMPSFLANLLVALEPFLTTWQNEIIRHTLPIT